MNLPRLSDEELPALPVPNINTESHGRFRVIGYTSDQLRAAMRAAAEAQRLKDEQWMREQKPAAYCRPDDPQNSTAFAWPGTDREEGHLAPLYAAPVPASQGDGELRRLILSAEAHRKDRDWELMILDLREAAALAAPVTTKEAEHG